MKKVRHRLSFGIHVFYWLCNVRKPLMNMQNLYITRMHYIKPVYLHVSDIKILDI